jgi:hypothetical protein
MHGVNESMEKLVGIYRHDFLNVLQVVGGLAQLNKTDRLLTYIRKASEEVQQFGRLIGCGDPRLAFLLYEALLQDRTGNYIVHVNGTIGLLEEQLLCRLAEFIQALNAELPLLEECTLTLTIHGPKKQLQLKILNDKNPEPFWVYVQQIADKSGLELTLNRKNIELTIPLDNRDSEGEN